MNNTATILIVEDNPGDYELCLSALTQDSNLANPIQWCQTGDEALDYLFKRNSYDRSDIEKPGLILLDLNLPGIDGREVLMQVKAEPNLKMVPVIIMTSSKDNSDIDDCYEIGANSYVVKPVNIDGLVGAISRLQEHWFQVVVSEKVKNVRSDVCPNVRNFWTLVMQLSVMLRDHNDRMIKEAFGLDISRGEIMTLSCLRLSSEPHELRQNEISSLIMMTTGAVTNTCRQLVKRGWIERRKDPSDARSTFYRLTDKGVEVSNTIIPIIHGTEKRATSFLNESELDDLCQKLERIKTSI